MLNTLVEALSAASALVALIVSVYNAVNSRAGLKAMEEGQSNVWKENERIQKDLAVKQNELREELTTAINSNGDQFRALLLAGDHERAERQQQFTDALSSRIIQTENSVKQEIIAVVKQGEREVFERLREVELITVTGSKPKCFAP